MLSLALFGLLLYILLTAQTKQTSVHTEVFVKKSKWPPNYFFLLLFWSVASLSFTQQKKIWRDCSFGFLVAVLLIWPGIFVEISFIYLSHLLIYFLQNVYLFLQLCLWIMKINMHFPSKVFSFSHQTHETRGSSMKCTIRTVGAVIITVNFAPPYGFWGVLVCFYWCLLLWKRKTKTWYGERETILIIFIKW